MTSSLSTISSSRSPEVAAARRLFLTLLIFVAPIFVLGTLVYGLGLRSGELVSVSAVASAQATSEPFIYLTKLSDHNFWLKLEAARRKGPEVLVLGSSRTNQWRSGMFKPYRFYNAGNAQFRFADMTSFVEKLDPPYPKLIIFSLDFYQFDSNWGRLYENLAYGDRSNPETLFVAKSLIAQYLRHPQLLARKPVDPIYGVPAIGLSASELGVGFRLDGSYQYGWAFKGAKLGADAAQAIDRIRTGTPPFLFADALDPVQVREFERFIVAAESRGIRLVGLTMPFDPAIPRAMSVSGRHGIWTSFYDRAFARAVVSRNIIYFDFTGWAGVDAKSEEYIDAFHVSETAYVRILLTMLARPEFRALVPELDEKYLLARLQAATAFEVFRNDF